MTTFDSVATPVIAYPQNPVTVSHTLGDGSGNDRIVFAFVEAIGGGSHVFGTAEYDGQVMTQLAQVDGTVFGAESTITIFYLLDTDLPATSGTYDFDYEINAGAYGSIGCVVSYTGSDQVAPPFQTSSSSVGGGGSGADISTNITPGSSPGLLVDFAGGGGTTTLTGSPGTGQTERLDTADADEYLWSSEKSYSSTAANSTEWTPSANWYTALHLVAEAADAGGGGSAGNAIMMGANF